MGSGCPGVGGNEIGGGDGELKKAVFCDLAMDSLDFFDASGEFEMIDHAFGVTEDVNLLRRGRRWRRGDGGDFHEAGVVPISKVAFYQLLLDG